MIDGLKDEQRSALIETLSANERVERVVLFGSRATQTYSATSDIDIALFGSNLTRTDLSRLAEAVDELPYPHGVDLLIYEKIRNEKLREEIDAHGVEWFNRRIDVSDWQTLSLSEAVQINPRVALKRGETYSYVGMADVDVGKRSVTASEDRTYKGSGSRFQPGDTLMARITPCLENGKIARFDGGGKEVTGFGSTEFIVIRGREEITDDAYAYYLTRSPEFREFAINAMTGTSGRQRVPVQALSDFAVSVPPLPEQRRIAGVLGALDDKIELNRRMNETLEEMARAVFNDWLVDFGPVRAKMEGREAYLPEEIWRLFPDRLVESELGLVPEGWGVKALDEIANYRNGLALQKFRPEPDEDRLPVVKIAQLRSGVADSGEWASASITPECVIDDGAVVFSWSGTLIVKIWTGGQAALNQHLFKVTSNEYPKWFYLHSTKHHLAEFQSIAADKTTTMGHIKRQHLKEAKCPVPDQELISAIDSTFSRLLDHYVSNDIASRRLAQMRDTLLPDLVSRAKTVENVA